jgi:5-methyltetrahydrofolate--homocysteine methyltransferase
MLPPFLRRLHEGVLILDGAMGTNIHRRNPEPADWGGEHLVNLSDAVSLTHPEWILDIHREFLAVGCDAVETNTFNGSRMVLGEFGMAERCRELNRLGAQLARQAADEFSRSDWPRFVIGSIGPGTKTPSLLNESTYASFDLLAESYRDQFRGLIEGGVDALLIETCFDILQAKVAVITALDVMRELGVQLPLMVQVTVERTGTMLPGTDIAAALTTLAAFPEVAVIGLNCATGPDLMEPHVKYLSQHCPKWISCLPNAGLPENRNGQTYFPLQPEELADWLDRFVREYGVNIVGGCCGTRPEHLAAVVKRLRGAKPAIREPKLEPSVSGLFGSVTLAQEPRPLLVGERTNTNGSRKFKQLLEAEDWEALVDMAREQEREGVHVLDVCTAYVGRDEVRDMREVLRRYNAVITKPLMIDSTQVDVIEAALKLVSGKPIINSVNLEDGREKFDAIVGLARRYGAALVCGTIDEEGMARTAERKFQVARRIYDLATQEFGLPPHDLIFDPLVLPITTGQEEERRNGLELIEGVRRIKSELPGAYTIVGLSNISFGLNPYARQVLNSVALHYLLEAGLDAAILHAAKILPLAQVDARGQELCRRLLFDDRSDGDPLQQLVEHYADKKASTTGNRSQSLGDTVEERLKQAIIQGRRETLVEDLDTARQRYSPLEIINDILLDGMKVVGDLFGSGKMQLPFVLQSAEVMKAAVKHLEQFMEKVEGTEKGRIVLATVKGDVHDIGKNLVDIILTNNGYKVYNLGIKVPVEQMLDAAKVHHADAIGMSGLLVKSTLVMKEDLMTLNSRGVRLPVILGGAALNRRYVEEDLRRIYRGPLFYGEDAFDGLRLMDQICSGNIDLQVQQFADQGTQEPQSTTSANGCCAWHVDRSGQRSKLTPAPNIPTPPFWGDRIVTEIPLAEVFRFINKRTLFSTQWQFRRGGVAPAEYDRIMREVAEPALQRLQERCVQERILQPAVVYGFFPCVSDGDDLVILHEDHRRERLRFQFPRQQGLESLCLSDYFTPAGAGRVDVVAFMAVTMGAEVSRKTQELFAQNKYQDYLFLHGLGVESAEALAEYFHQRIRGEWGIADQDATEVQKLFRKHYRGCRYSFGYPACPELEDQAKLFELLRPERIGLTLSDTFQLDPEQSTTALIVHHPQAKYFNVTPGTVATLADREQ